GRADPSLRHPAGRHSLPESLARLPRTGHPPVRRLRRRQPHGAVLQPRRRPDGHRHGPPARCRRGIAAARRRRIPADPGPGGPNPGWHGPEPGAPARPDAGPLTDRSGRSRFRLSRLQVAAAIALVYALFGAAWILYSDAAWAALSEIGRASCR